MPIKDQSGDTPNGAMIAVRDLRKAIGDEEILRGVNLDIAVAETLAIIGRSGGGKSVLLKHLIGLMQPDAGEIWVSGKNIIGMSRSEEHTSELQSRRDLVCRLLLEKKKMAAGVPIAGVIDHDVLDPSE